MLLDHVDLDSVARADLVLTAEGALDHQTPRGKVPAEVARRAKLSGRPRPRPGRHARRGRGRVPGVDACHGIMPAPMAGGCAAARLELLTDATERALRMVVLGSRLPGRAAQAPVPADGGGGRGGGVGRTTPVLGAVVPVGAVADQLLDGAHEPLDVLVRGARAEAAPADGVEGLLAGRRLGRPALALRLRVAAGQGAHQRVGAEQAVAHADAVLGGERGGEVRAVPALDDEGGRATRGASSPKRERIRASGTSARPSRTLPIRYSA